MSLAHFTTLFRMVQEILYFRNHMLGMSDNIVESPSVVFFCMQEPLPKVGVLLESLCMEKNLNYHICGHYLEGPEINVLLKKHTVWKILELSPKYYSSLCCLLKLNRRFHFSSSILHNLLGSYIYIPCFIVHHRY